jgi:8-oxo-dGTP pyrophosphatase MutT (NUDIX family)
VTRETVRARFAAHHHGLRLSESAKLVRGDHSLTPNARPPTGTLVPAAVLVPLVDRPGGLTILLTQRTAHLSAHAGQIAFPGGHVDPEDGDVVDAALREAEEEVGLPRDHVEVVGQLDTYITGTGFEISPIVALVRSPFPLKLDPFEVAEAFEVPLAFVLEPANHERHTRELRGHMRSFYVLPFENRRIWGATAAMLVNLAEVLSG